MIATWAPATKKPGEPPRSPPSSRSRRADHRPPPRSFPIGSRSVGEAAVEDDRPVREPSGEAGHAPESEAGDRDPPALGPERAGVGPPGRRSYAGTRGSEPLQQRRDDRRTALGELRADRLGGLGEAHRCRILAAAREHAAGTVAVGSRRGTQRRPAGSAPAPDAVTSATASPRSTRRRLPSTCAAPSRPADARRGGRARRVRRRAARARGRARARSGSAPTAQRSAARRRAAHGSPAATSTPRRSAATVTTARPARAGGWRRSAASLSAPATRASARSRSTSSVRTASPLGLVHERRHEPVAGGRHVVEAQRARALAGAPARRPPPRSRACAARPRAPHARRR